MMLEDRRITYRMGVNVVDVFGQKIFFAATERTQRTNDAPQSATNQDGTLLGRGHAEFDLEFTHRNVWIKKWQA